MLVVAGGRDVELALPVLRVADSEGAFQVGVGERLALVGVQRSAVALE
jgi:hypothetical protein